MGLAGQSEPENNNNEEVFHSPQNSRKKASPSDEVYCYTQDTLFFFCGVRGLTLHNRATQSAYSKPGW